jgi:hypothetical protein
VTICGFLLFASCYPDALTQNGSWEMDMKMLIVPAMFLSAICGSFLLGLFSRMPLWLIGILASTFPMLLFCISIPRTQWAEGMMVIGGYAVMVGPFLGMGCYALAKFARQSAELGREQARARRTYGRRS